MTRISKKTEKEIADRFEGALDQCTSLDSIPFYRKREAAESAAAAALASLTFAGK